MKFTEWPPFRDEHPKKHYLKASPMDSWCQRQKTFHIFNWDALIQCIGSKNISHQEHSNVFNLSILRCYLKLTSAVFSKNYKTSLGRILQALPLFIYLTSPPYLVNLCPTALKILRRGAIKIFSIFQLFRKSLHSFQYCINVVEQCCSAVPSWKKLSKDTSVPTFNRMLVNHIPRLTKFKIKWYIEGLSKGGKRWVLDTAVGAYSSYKMLWYRRGMLLWCWKQSTWISPKWATGQQNVS